MERVTKRQGVIYAAGVNLIDQGVFHDRLFL